MLYKRLLKLLIISLVLCLQIKEPSYALTDTEVMSLKVLAKKKLAAGSIDDAIKIYHDLIEQGEYKNADELSKIYNNKKKNYFQAGLWCYVAIENYTSENANCENLSFSKKFRDKEVRNIRRLAIQCIATNYKHCDELSARFDRDLDVYYSKYCTVADPNDTKFNLREQPNGKLIRDFENGYTVIKKEIALDKNGREWMMIADDFYGFTLGWVVANFVKCNTRKRL